MRRTFFECFTRAVAMRMKTIDAPAYGLAPMRETAWPTSLSGSAIGLQRWPSKAPR